MPAEGEAAVKVRGYVGSANGDNTVPLKAYLQALGSDCKAVAAQEHRVLLDGLPQLERDLLDLGYHGFFGPAYATGQGGTLAGRPSSARAASPSLRRLSRLTGGWMA